MIVVISYSLYTHTDIWVLIMIKYRNQKEEKQLAQKVMRRTWFVPIQASFCGSVSNAETVFSNLIRCRGAPLCLIAQAVLSSSGQRAFNMENTWLFNLLAFFITSKRPSHPFNHTKKPIRTKSKYGCKGIKAKLNLRLAFYKFTKCITMQTVT